MIGPASSELSLYSSGGGDAVASRLGGVLPAERHEPTRQRPRVGVVLGGGGAKAAAHVGVLRVLQAAGVPIDYVAGSSAGAFVGLFHCGGYTPNELVIAMREEFGGRGLWRWVPGGGYWRLARLLRRGGLRDIIARRATFRRLEDLPTKLLVTATDLVSGEAVILDRGPVEHAVLASMSLPGLAPPVPDGQRLLVDGSILNDLPVQELRERGADVVIAVDLSAAHVPRPHDIRHRVSTSRVVLRSWQLQQQRLAVQLAGTIDVLIQPDLSASSMADFSNLDRLVEIGAAATEVVLDKILSRTGVRNGMQPACQLANCRGGRRRVCQLAR